MTINVIKCLTQVASYLKVNTGKINLISNSMPMRTFNNVTTKGFVSIIFQFLKEAKCTIENHLQATEIRQWLEYCIIYVLDIDSQGVEQILKELDNFLSTKTYLISFDASIADVTLFHSIYNIMVNLSYLDKEKYLNLSRWFDNLQQNDLIRQKNKMVDFSTNYLKLVAPSRH